MSATIRRVLLYGVLALCLCGFAYVQGRADQQASVVEQAAHQLLAGHAGYQHLQDSLRLVELRFVGEEAFWRAKADSLGMVSRSLTLQSNSSSAASPRDTSLVYPVNSLASNDSQRIVFLGRALDACDASRGAVDSALAACGRRSDSLEASLRAVLKTRECALPFGIRCPSRGVMFLGGAVLGALLENHLIR